VYGPSPSDAKKKDENTQRKGERSSWGGELYKFIRGGGKTGPTYGEGKKRKPLHPQSPIRPKREASIGTGRSLSQPHQKKEVDILEKKRGGGKEVPCNTEEGQTTAPPGERKGK